MASTPTSRLRLNKQATYDNPNSWGVVLNNGALDMADEGWATVEITVNADVTLDVQNYLTDEARGFTIIASGDGGHTVTAPSVDKPYLVVNDCAADIVMEPFGGSGATIRAGTQVLYFVNAGGSAARVVDPTMDKIAKAAADVDFNGQSAINLAQPVADQDAVTKKYLDDLAASSDLGTVAAIADEIVTVAHIQDGTVATNAVTDVAAIDDEIVIVAGIDDAVVQLAGMFVGASATDPATRLDGSPLQAGDYYLNTGGTPAVRIYSGSAWIPIEAVTIASQGEAEAGVNNTNVMTPLRTKQAIDAQRPAGSTGVSVTKTDTFSLSTTATWTDIPGLEVTITPGSTSKKVLVSAVVTIGSDTASGGMVALRFTRDGTPIAVGGTEGSRTPVTSVGVLTVASSMASVPVTVLDAPISDAPVVYKVQMRIVSGNGYVNRSSNDTNGASTYRAASTLTATEYL